MPSNPRTAKTRGRAAENAARDWLRAHGWPHAERLRLTGAADRGDLTGIPGMVVEVKAAGGMSVGEMLTELETEQTNQARFAPSAGLPDGLVIVRRRGVPDVARWGALMPVEQAFRWLLELDGRTP